MHLASNQKCLAFSWEKAVGNLLFLNLLVPVQRLL